MWIAGDSLRAREVRAAESPSRIRFVGRQIENPAGNCLTESVATHRVTPAPALQSVSGDEICQLQSTPSRIHRQRADIVPEVSYQLRSGCYVSATISSRVCRGLADRGAESNEHGREVGGIVVGHWCKQQRADGKSEHTLSLTDLIAVASYDSSSAHISFTERAWVQAEEELTQKYASAGKIGLGWYHTHPIQGIFFSSKDHSAHAIFGEPYQFALVIDPLRMEAGWFYWASYEERILAGPICFALIRGRK